MQSFKILAIMCIIALPIAAHAQTANGTGSLSSNTNTDVGAGATAIAEGGEGFKHSSISTTPALATLLNSPTAPCEATYSGTASVTGFGIGISGAKVNEVCENLEIIRATYNMQQQATATLMMCQFPQFRFARQVEGNPCPASYSQAGDPVVAQTQPVDATTSIPAAPGSAASYQVPGPAPSFTPSAQIPVNTLPDYCNAPDTSTDPAEQAQYNHDCKQ